MENDNFGDTLIAETTSEILKKEGYVVVNHEIGGNPNDIILLSYECDFLLFAGGGIIERYIPPLLRRFSEYVSELSIPYGVMGVSVGDFNYDHKSISLGKWVDESVFFYTRDERSRKILNKYSKTNKAKYTGDCVFLTNRLNSYTNYNRDKVGINIRDLPYTDLTGELDWNRILEIMDIIKSDVIIMDSSDDIRHILIEQKEIDKYYDYIKKNKSEKVEQIIDEINECGIIVAMRYHVILIAALLGIPTVAIKYCPKVETLVEQLELHDISVDINDYNGILKKYDYLCNHYKEYKEKLLTNVKIMKKRVVDMYEEVLVKLKETM